MDIRPQALAAAAGSSWKQLEVYNTTPLWSDYHSALHQRAQLDTKWYAYQMLEHCIHHHCVQNTLYGAAV